MKAVEYYKVDLMAHLTRSLENSRAKSYANCEDPDEEVSGVN